MKDIKQSVKKDLQDGVVMDVDCPYCEKLITDAEIKDKVNYTCPFCQKEFSVDLDFSKF
jgi:uncharacterized Zn-finger protein